MLLPCPHRSISISPRPASLLTSLPPPSSDRPEARRAAGSPACSKHRTRRPVAWRTTCATTWSSSPAAATTTSSTTTTSVTGSRPPPAAVALPACRYFASVRCLLLRRVSSVSLWQLSLRTKFNSMEHKHRLASSPVLWACLA